MARLKFDDRDPINKITPTRFIYLLNVIQTKIHSFLHYYDVIPDDGILVKEYKIKNPANVKNIYNMNTRIPDKFNKMGNIPSLYRDQKTFFCGDIPFIDFFTVLNNAMNNEQWYINRLFYNPDHEDCAKTFNELANSPINELIFKTLCGGVSISNLFSKRVLNPNQDINAMNTEMYKVSFDISRMVFTITTHINYDALIGFSRFLGTFAEVVRCCEIGRRQKETIRERFGNSTMYYVNNTMNNLKDEMQNPFAGIKDLVLTINGLSNDDVEDITPPKYVYVKSQEEAIVDETPCEELPDEAYIDIQLDKISKKHIDEDIKGIMDKADAFADAISPNSKYQIVDIDMEKTIFINTKIDKEDLTNLLSSRENYYFFDALFNPKQVLAKFKNYEKKASEMVKIATEINIDSDKNDYETDLKRIGEYVTQTFTIIDENPVKRAKAAEPLALKLSNRLTDNNISLPDIFSQCDRGVTIETLQELSKILNSYRKVASLFKFKLEQLEIDDENIKPYHDIIIQLDTYVTRDIKIIQSYVIFNYIMISELLYASNWKTRCGDPDNGKNGGYSITTSFIQPLLKLGNGTQMAEINNESIVLESGANFHDGESYFNNPEEYPERERYFGKSIRPLMQTDNKSSLSSLFVTELPQVIAALLGHGINSLLIPTNMTSNEDKAKFMTSVLDKAPIFPIPLNKTMYIRSGYLKPTRITTYLNAIKDVLFNEASDNKQLQFNTDEISTNHKVNIGDIRYVNENNASDALLKKFNFEIFIDMVTLNGNPVNSSILLSNFNSTFGVEKTIVGIENMYINQEDIIIERYVQVLKDLIETVDDTYSIDTARNGNIFDDLANAEVVFVDLLFFGISRLFSNIGGLDIYFKGGLTTPNMFNISRQITDFKIKKKDILLMQLLNNFCTSYDNILLDEAYSRNIADMIYNRDITFSYDRVTLLDFIKTQSLDDSELDDTISVTYNGSGVLNTILLLWNNMKNFRGSITKLDRNSQYTKTEAINILTPLLLYMIASVALNLKDYNDKFLEVIKHSAEARFDKSY